MSDPLSIAGTVAGLVTLADMVFVRTFRYVREIKSIDKTMDDLAKVLQHMCGTLHMLEQRLRVIEAQQSHQNLRMLPPILEDCNQLLADIDSKLAKYQKHNNANGLGKVASGLKKLRWPFDISSTKQLLKQLNEFNDVLNTALSANTMIDVHQTLQEVNELGQGMNKLERSLSMKHNQLLQVELDKEQRKAIKHFQTSDPAERHKVAIDLWERGTGKWFTEGEDFVSWFEGRTPKLWLSGIPGAGKTVLASSIIEKAKRECRNSTYVCALAYFYCDYKDSRTHDISNILDSLAAQIAVHNKDTLKALIEYYHKFRQSGRALTLEEPPALIDMIRDMARSFRKVLLIVDGLDECGEHVHKVTKELDSLVMPSPTTISILLLSRHEQEIQHVLADGYVHVPIAARSPDLKLYVCAQMAKRTADGRLIIDNIDIKSKIVDRLVHGADGMFRWAQCQLDYLCDLASDSEREAALGDLPPDLNSSYERILHRVNQKVVSVRKVVRRTLMWVIRSADRLSIVALREALAVEEGQGTFDKKKMPAEAFILRHCSSLVRKSADGNFIEPAHFTVKEYLERIALGNEAYAYYRVDSVDTKLYMATVCMTFLNYSDFDNFERLVDTKQRLQAHPFYEHAAKYWIDYSRDHMEDKSVLPLVQTLMKPERTTNFLTWLHDYLRVVGTEQGSSREHKNRISQLINNVNTLHCAAFLRIPCLVSWLVRCGMDVNAISAIGSPLHCAILGVRGLSSYINCISAYYNHRIDWSSYSTMKALLENKADPNQGYSTQASSRQVSPLYILLHGHASNVDHQRSCIELLLTSGAKLDATSGEVIASWKHLNPTLECFTLENVEEAYHADFLDMKRVFMDMAKIRDHDNALSIDKVPTEQLDAKMLHSALRFATQIQHSSKLEELLLRKDIDINATDDTGSSALHIAAKQGNLLITKMLLNHGANFNAVDYRGNTPLHRCADHIKPGVISLLLSKGADASKENDLGETMWSRAAECRNHAVFQLVDTVFDGQEEKICKILSSSNGPLFQAISFREALLSMTSNDRRVNVFDEEGRNLAHFASNMSLQLLQTLKDRGLKFEHIDSLGRSALHAVAQSSARHTIVSELIRFLIKEGCNVEYASPTQGTALHVLLLNESFMNNTKSSTRNDSIELLLTKPVISSVNSDGMTALDLFIVKSWHQPYSLEIIDLVMSRNLQQAFSQHLFANFVRLLPDRSKIPSTDKTVLIARASNVLCRLLKIHEDPGMIARSETGSIAAVWAARNSMSDLLLDLVLLGVSVTYKDKNSNYKSVLQNLVQKHHEQDTLRKIIGLIDISDLQVRYAEHLSLLHLSCTKNASRASVIPMLLGRGLEIDATSDAGHTPVMFAVAAGKTNHVQCLIENGASTTRRDWGGWSVLQHACYQRQHSVLDYLISHCSKSLPWDDKVTVAWPRRDGTTWIVAYGASVIYLGASSATIMRLLLDKHPNLDLSVATTSGQTVLHFAVLVGNHQVVDLLLDRGIKMQSRDSNGDSALHYAALENRLDMIQMLARRQMCLDAKNRQGWTALHCAAFKGNESIIRCLLNVGAASFRDLEGLTPESLARSRGYNQIAELLNQHFEHDKDFEARELHSAPSSRARHKIDSALTRAIITGNHRLVHELVASDEDKEHPSCSGCSPVLTAMTHQQWGVVKILIDEGYTADGMTCWHQEYPGMTALHIAAMLAAPRQVFQALLSTSDRNDIFAQFPFHPLHLVALHNQTASVGLLLESLSGPDTDVSTNILNCFMVDIEHKTCRSPRFRRILGNDACFAGSVLHIAAFRNDRRIVEILLKHGADIEVTTPGTLSTPLHFAAAGNSLGVIELLLNRGANIASRNVNGGTPLSVAIWQRKMAAVELLLKRDACLDIDDMQVGHNGIFLADDRFASMILSKGLSSESLTEACISRKSLWTDGGGTLLFHGAAPISTNFKIQIDSLSHHIHQVGVYRLKMVLKWLAKNDLLSVQLHLRSFSPLCVAVQRGSLEAVKLLIAVGADIDEHGCQAGTPLMFACDIGRSEVVKFLVRRGASLMTTTHEDGLKSALDKACKFEKITRWLLVDRWTDQRRIDNSPYDSEISARGFQRWSGFREVRAPLPLRYKQWRDETLLQWHIRKRRLLRTFEGKILHYGPSVKYIFATPA